MCSMLSTPDGQPHAAAQAGNTGVPHAFAVAFQLYDLDGDGFVSTDEITKVRQAVFFTMKHRFGSRLVLEPCLHLRA